MKRIIHATAMTLIAVGLLPTASAQSITVTVDCSRGQTIANALKQGDFRKPLVVVVRGTCNEHVSISRDDVTLRGESGTEPTVNGRDSGTDTIVILKDTVSIEDLTVTGGYNGIRLQGPFSAVVKNVFVRYTAMNGIHVRAGDMEIENSTVEYAGGSGLGLVRAASVRIFSNSHFQHNHLAGIYAEKNSTVSVSGGTVNGNGRTGIELMSGSEGTFNDGTISANGMHGIQLSQGSEGVIAHNTISHNGNAGVMVETGSHSSFNNNTITANGTNPAGSWKMGVMVASGDADFLGDNISDNPGDGLWLERARIDFAGGTITGNGGSGIFALFAANFSAQSNLTTISGNHGYGIALMQNSVGAIFNAQLHDNGSWGIFLVQGSQLMLGQTDASGNDGGVDLYCGDHESSYAGGFRTGTISPDCTDFNH